jgi:excinuclease ABC subunit B
MLSTRFADARGDQPTRRVAETKASYADEVNLEEWSKILEQQMREAATALDFEAAARLRDQLFEVKARMAGSGARPALAADAAASSRR